MENTYFRKGFGLKSEIAGRLTADYHSACRRGGAGQRLSAARWAR